jgi:tetratricopeptide (TPR) repeat protein
MNHLLKAMGIWIWGLIAIGLSVSVVSVSYRLMALYRAQNSSATHIGQIETGASADLRMPLRLATTAGNAPMAAANSGAGKDLGTARIAIQSSRWAQAIDILRMAETEPSLSSADKRSIYELKAFVYMRLKDLRAAQSAYEAALATGGQTLEDEARIFRYLFQLAAANGQGVKAIDYGKRALGTDAAKPNDLLIMSQLYFQQGDCRNSIAWGDKAVAAYREAAQAPQEGLYQIKLQCSSYANDSNGMVAGLSELIRLTHKSTYWNNLLRIERAQERDDHNTVMIYRLMYDTKSMTVDSDYIEMAQLLQDAGLPAEARAVLGTAMTSSLVKDEHKERVDRLWHGLSARIDADPETAPRAGMPLDEEIILRARSEVILRNYPQAVKALAELNQVPGISPRISMLWSLYAETLGSNP